MERLRFGGVVLENMFIMQSTFNIRDNTPADSEAAAECRLTDAFLTEAADLSDIIVAKFAASSSSMIFRNRIVDIVLVSSEKAMLWMGSYAQRVVASVKNMKAFWDGSIRQLPGEPMSSDVPAFEMDLPVTPIMQAAGPEPTSLSLPYSLPKGFHGIRYKMRHA